MKCMVSICSYSQVHGAKKSDVSSPTQKNTDSNQTRDVFQKHLQFVLVRKNSIRNPEEEAGESWKSPRSF